MWRVAEVGAPSECEREGREWRKHGEGARGQVKVFAKSPPSVCCKACASLAFFTCEPVRGLSDPTSSHRNPHRSPSPPSPEISTPFCVSNVSHSFETPANTRSGIRASCRVLVHSAFGVCDCLRRCQRVHVSVCRYAPVACVWGVCVGGVGWVGVATIPRQTYLLLLTLKNQCLDLPIPISSSQWHTHSASHTPLHSPATSHPPSFPPPSLSSSLPLPCLKDEVTPSLESLCHDIPRH